MKSPISTTVDKKKIINLQTKALATNATKKIKYLVLKPELLPYYALNFLS